MADGGWRMSVTSLELPGSGISNKGQVGSTTQNGTHHTIHKAEHAKHENTIMPPNHQLIPQPGPTRTEYPLDEQGQNQQHVQGHRLHRVEPHVVAKARVSDHSQIEGEESHEARIGHRPVEAQ